MEKNSQEIENDQPKTSETRKRGIITEKYMEENCNMQKVKSDNVLRSTGHYLKKNYMPTPNCKFIKYLLN